MVTPGGVVGLNCFGFADEIRPGDQPNDQWRQHINHTDNRIPNPVTTSEKQQVLLRRAMDRAGLSGIPVEDTHETDVKLKSLVTVYKSEKNKKKKK